MQEKQIIMDKRKFKLIASSRLATCYHPIPEGMGIRAGISIIIINQFKFYDYGLFKRVLSVLRMF